MNIFNNLFAKYPLLNISKQFRRRRASRKQQKVQNFWRPIVADYFEGKIPGYQVTAKKELADRKIIWQYWGQGIDGAELPEVVKLCFGSVDRYKGDYEVIRLSDETVKDYLELPSFVYQKLHNNTFSRTFFSDLLRLALLKTYGGVWLDATILLTSQLPAKFAQANYFMYQRDDNEPNKTYWEDTNIYYWGWHPNFTVTVLNSIIFAQKSNVVITTLLNLILYYWETQDKVIDYYFFQGLYHQLINNQLTTEKCAAVSDTLPHLLQAKMKYPNRTNIEDEQILKANGLHKLCYFKPKALVRLREFYERNALGIDNSTRF